MMGVARVGDDSLLCYPFVLALCGDACSPCCRCALSIVSGSPHEPAHRAEGRENLQAVDAQRQ